MTSSSSPSEDEILARADEALERRQFEQARDLLREGLQAHPDSVRIITLLAGVLRLLGQSGEALEILQHASHLAEADFDVLFELGIALRQEGYIWEAIRVHSKLVETSDSHPEARHQLAVDHTELGLMDKALPVLQQLVTEAPGDSSYRVSLARGLIKVGRCTEALQILEEVVDEHPRNVESLLAQAEAHGRLLHSRAWMQIALNVIAIAPHNPGALVLVSDTYTAQGDLERAIAAASEALSIRPRMWQAQVSLGSLDWKQGELVRAERWFRAAAAIAPWDGSTIGMLAQFQVETRRGTPVLEDLERAARAIPHARLPFYLGRLYFGTLGNLDKALEFLGLAVEIAPEDLESVRLLAETHIAREEYDDAVGLLERIGELSPDLSLVWSALAYTQIRLGNVDAAAQAYERAIALGAKSPDVYHGYGIALMELGRVEQALGQLTEAARLAPDDQGIKDDLERARGTVSQNRAAG